MSDEQHQAGVVANSNRMALQRAAQVQEETPAIIQERQRRR